MNPVSTTWRIVFAALALAFDAAIIWWTVLFGQPQNSLHASAQSWAWMSGLLVLSGVGVSAVSTRLVDLVAQRLGSKP